MSQAVPRRGRTLAAVTAIPLLAGMIMVSTSAQASPDGRTAIPGTRPTWATASADRGATNSGAAVSARVYLAGRDAPGLGAYATAVSRPDSPLYHKYLTPDQYQQRFGPSDAQVRSVTGWLAANKLAVDGVTKHYVSFHGTVANTQSAFDTVLHNYTKDGSTVRAPQRDASVPANVANAVLTVTGLSTAPVTMRSGAATPAPPAAGFRNAQPCSGYYGAKTADGYPQAYGGTPPVAVCGYTGAQLRGAYGVTGSGLTGKGVTVAIIDAFASPTLASDADTYNSNNGEQPLRPGQLSQYLPDHYTNTDPSDATHPNGCGASNWFGEQSLDVEAVHNIAPDADIAYVGAVSCLDTDLQDALDKVVDNRLATIVSNSWGDVAAHATPDLTKRYEQTFLQGAVEGIGFYFSSGDNGDEKASSGTLQVDYPTSDPWVTSVGGTSLAVDHGNHYQWETGWGVGLSALAADKSGWDPQPPGTFQAGAGGGTSTLFPQPYYQRGVAPDTLAKANGAKDAMRVVPDVAAVADANTGMLIGQTQTFPDGVKYDQYRLGGTSLACPVFAGIQALAQQAQHGVPIGFANNAIYFRYGTSAFHDVTDHPLGAGQSIANLRADYVNKVDATGGLSYSLRTFGHDSSLAATPGYDDVTGVGSPSRDYLNSFRTR